MKKDKQNKFKKGVDKFTDKCRKRLEFLKSHRYEKNNMDELMLVRYEVINAIKGSPIDVETHNRIHSHPERLIYHANKIIHYASDDIKNNKQSLKELKVIILYHDISKCIDFDKYNAKMKSDHALFSSIILDIVMHYLEFDDKVIERMVRNIKYHSDKDNVIENNLDYNGKLLVDVDVLDEQDIYGVFVELSTHTTDKGIDKNNKLSQQDLSYFMEWFISGMTINDKSYLEESKKYNTQIYEQIKILKSIIEFKNEEVYL